MKRINLLLAAVFCGAVAAHAATFTFTTCGATGAAGPDQSMCDGAYGAGVVAVSAGIQSWTVPATGTYRITATGARGTSADVTFLGGRGARITGDFNLTAGQVLKLAVGQQGLGTPDNDGGGGGGSFIVSAADAPMLIAGGGGGTRSGVDQNGCDASVTQRAGVGSANQTTSSCALKGGSEGDGGIISSDSWGSAGAGFLSDGASDPDGGGTHGGGYSWANGMLGGVSDGGGTTADGGFGGGGDGRGSNGGGGGGGYSGGDGGRLAGGGGSFNAGANPAAVTGVGTAAGRIVITDDLVPVVAATAVPALSGRMLIALASLMAFGALVTLHRRRTIR